MNPIPPLWQPDLAVGPFDKGLSLISQVVTLHYSLVNGPLPKQGEEFYEVLIPSWATLSQAHEGLQQSQYLVVVPVPEAAETRETELSSVAATVRLRRPMSLFWLG